MRNLVILFVHVLATLARLWGPGGIRSVVAESVLVKHPQSFAAAAPQSPHFRSPRRRFVRSPYSPRPPDPFSHSSETFDSAEPPPSSKEPEISTALLIPARG